jgi:hypothetical protein
MARPKKTHSEETPGTGEADISTVPTEAPTSEISAAEVTNHEMPAQDTRKPILTPDPRPIMSISLGDSQGSPRVQLRRSHKYKQMQIQFDRQPDEKYMVRLKEAGWTDRTESEGIWTKQIPNGQWQPVADAERLFKEIGNGIRADKGLEPVMGGLAVA